MAMKNKRSPPARIRYEQSHPVVSFRVKQADYDRLQEMLGATGKSIGDFFRDALAVQKTNTDAIYANAKQESRIWYYCSVCGREISIDPNGKAHKVIIEYLKTNEWSHPECNKSKRIDDKKSNEIELKRMADEFIAALNPIRHPIIIPNFIKDL
jgi:hypothetical protein